ncbi:hypothetical protein Xen7305DRAFT_00008120 [Xenococcus sp. PCC 7305]|uniref:hypothetical protein n=1 Tax=Xenococcus sp. PCC 7305 TaxID=102125 RepID=UPI0002AC2764|nr:hypothetical protein [Xenococcus sp. PCC 7305]ELS01110.1 hypothetical protein Xen7305DRAFT_00008120 [Xenococcus sp. PCC 7305]
MDLVTSLKQAIALKENIIEKRESLKPPVAPSILTAGTTKEDLDEYKARLAEYQKQDLDAIREEIHQNSQELKDLESRIAKLHQEQILAEFQEDRDRVNTLLEFAWEELDKVAKKYSTQEAIAEYHQGFNCGNPLRMDLGLTSLRNNYPCLEIAGYRLNITPRSRKSA